jgi:hypothetical protein
VWECRHENDGSGPPYRARGNSLLSSFLVGKMKRRPLAPSFSAVTTSLYSRPQLLHKRQCVCVCGRIGLLRARFGRHCQTTQDRHTCLLQKGLLPSWLWLASRRTWTSQTMHDHLQFASLVPADRIDSAVKFHTPLVEKGSMVPIHLGHWSRLLNRDLLLGTNAGPGFSTNRDR